MKVSIDRKKFIQALSLGSSFSAKNKALMALDYTKVALKGETCRISSNDGGVAISTLADGVSFDEESELFLDSKKVLSALKSINEESVTLDINEKNVIIKHKTGKFSIPLGDVEEFPTLTMDNETTIVEIPSSILFDWLKVAREFVGNDMLRPIMTGIYIYANEKECGVCASDGCRLFADYNMEITSETEVNAVLSEKAVSTLMTMINGTDNTTVYFGERNVAFRAGNTSIMCRKIEGRYPNFKAVIPNSCNYMCEFKKEDFLASLDRVLIMANASSLVKMQVDNKTCKLIAEDIDFSQSGEDSLELLEPMIGNITIGYKGVYAHTCINAISGETVRVEMTSNDRALKICDPHKPTLSIVLMPVMLS